MGPNLRKKVGEPDEDAVQLCSDFLGGVLGEE